MARVARVDGAADACADLHREPARVVDLRDVQAAVRPEGEVDDRREAVEDERALLLSRTARCARRARSATPETSPVGKPFTLRRSTRRQGLRRRSSPRAGRGSVAAARRCPAAGHPKIAFAFAVETSSSGSVATSFTRLTTSLFGELPSRRGGCCCLLRRRRVLPATGVRDVERVRVDRRWMRIDLLLVLEQVRNERGLPEMRQIPWPVSSDPFLLLRSSPRDRRPIEPRRPSPRGACDESARVPIDDALSGVRDEQRVPGRGRSRRAAKLVSA